VPENLVASTRETVPGTVFPFIDTVPDTVSAGGPERAMACSRQDMIRSVDAEQFENLRDFHLSQLYNGVVLERKSLIAAR